MVWPMTALLYLTTFTAIAGFIGASGLQRRRLALGLAAASCGAGLTVIARELSAVGALPL